MGPVGGHIIRAGDYVICIGPVNVDKDNNYTPDDYTDAADTDFIMTAFHCFPFTAGSDGSNPAHVRQAQVQI